MTAFASVHATSHVVTPMVLAEAAGAASRFSIVSFRGLLRFWWHARAYPRLLRACNSDGARALKELAAAAARLFGSASGVDQGGQSVVFASLTASDPGTPIARRTVLNAASTGASTGGAADPKENVVGPGARSLAYGVIKPFMTREKYDAGKPKKNPAGERIPKEKGEQLMRSCFPDGGSFTIGLKVRQLRKEPQENDANFEKRKQAIEKRVEDIVATLKLLSLLGGMGARTRRGWGSLSLERIGGTIDGRETPPWSKPTTKERFRESLRALLPLSFAPATEPPPFFAFFAGSCIEILYCGDDAPTFSNAVGDAFLDYRGWRHAAHERNFPHDHDGFKKHAGRWTVPTGASDSACLSAAMEHFLRVAFGLPHNCAKWLRIEAEKHDRRANPLLFQIHALGDQYAAISTFLPAWFLPKIVGDPVTRDEKVTANRPGLVRRRGRFWAFA